MSDGSGSEAGEFSDDEYDSDYGQESNPILASSSVNHNNLPSLLTGTSSRKRNILTYVAPLSMRNKLIQCKEFPDGVMIDDNGHIDLKHGSNGSLRLLKATKRVSTVDDVEAPDRWIKKVGTEAVVGDMGQECEPSESEAEDLSKDEKGCSYDLDSCDDEPGPGTGVGMNRTKTKTKVEKKEMAKSNKRKAPVVKAPESRKKRKVVQEEEEEEDDDLDDYDIPEEDGEEEEPEYDEEEEEDDDAEEEEEDKEDDEDYEDDDGDEGEEEEDEYEEGEDEEGGEGEDDEDDEDEYGALQKDAKIHHDRLELEQKKKADHAQGQYYMRRLEAFCDEWQEFQKQIPMTQKLSLHPDPQFYVTTPQCPIQVRHKRSRNNFCMMQFDLSRMGCPCPCNQFFGTDIQALHNHLWSHHAPEKLYKFRPNAVNPAST